MVLDIKHGWISLIAEGNNTAIAIIISLETVACFNALVTACKLVQKPYSVVRIGEHNAVKS